MNSSSKRISFASLFSTRDIICQTDVVDRDELIKKLLKMLAYNHGVGDVDLAFKKVLAREKKMPTIIASGIAMPHIRLDDMNKVVVGIATSRQGIKFNGDESSIAYLVIILLAPKDQPGVYLQAVGSLVKALQEPGVAQRVADMNSTDEIWRFFERGGLVLPEYICAGDFMDRDVAVLMEHDNLARAIDMLVDHQKIDIPVVDKSGSIIGVVTAFELLKVCLPDYILWMDDLSPIINFEPFAQMLHNESKAWLTEVMSTDFASVSVDAPAIQVAREITKHNARQVYVLDGEKLEGVITIQNFIGKVLRE